MIVLDPSTEIAPMVSASRNAMGQKVICLDPKTPHVGFNVLDWIGQFGSSMEEDMATVAAWLMSERPRIASGADDFFRTNAEQLITSVIAHVVFSDLANTAGKRSLRTVRSILTKPEESLKEFLADIHDTAPNEFVKELVGPFINMTPQTFSGVYATAAKETHWLSYDAYAALVSGNTFKTDIIANGRTTLFLNIDLSTLENHPGMARVIIGAFLKAVYNRDGAIEGQFSSCSMKPQGSAICASWRRHAMPAANMASRFSCCSNRSGKCGRLSVGAMLLPNGSNPPPGCLSRRSTIRTRRGIFLSAAA
jgi:type IV secretion system protein VirD4